MDAVLTKLFELLRPAINAVIIRLLDKPENQTKLIAYIEAQLEAEMQRTIDALPTV